MTEQQPSPSPTSQEAKPVAVIESTPENENQKLTEEQTTEVLKEIQENAGQISELASEEDTLIEEFFSFLGRIMKNFAKTLEIPVSSLPDKYSRRAGKAYLYPNGQLVLIYVTGEVDTVNLAVKENRQVLIEIAGGIMTTLKTIINTHKSKTEKRVRFLMQISKGLQKVAEAFSEDTGKK